MSADNIDRFLYAPTTRDDVFDDEEFFVKGNLETAAQNKFAIFFFNKDVALA